MNKTAFWAGLSFQIIQFGALFIFGSIFILSGIDWSFLTSKVIFIAVWIVMNIVSFIMIFAGIFTKEN